MGLCRISIVILSFYLCNSAEVVLMVDEFTTVAQYIAFFCLVGMSFYENNIPINQPIPGQVKGGHTAYGIYFRTFYIMNIPLTNLVDIFVAGCTAL